MPNLFQIFLCIYITFGNITSTHFGISEKSLDEYYIAAFINEKISSGKREEVINRLNGFQLMTKMKKDVNTIIKKIGWMNEQENEWRKESESKVLENFIMEKYTFGKGEPEYFSNEEEIKILLKKTIKVQEKYNREIFKIDRKDICKLWVQMRQLRHTLRKLVEEETEYAFDSFNEFCEEQCNLFGEENILGKSKEVMEKWEKAEEEIRKDIAELHFQSLNELVGKQYAGGHNIPTKLEEMFSEKKIEGESELAFRLRIGHISATLQKQKGEEKDIKGKGKNINKISKSNTGAKKDKTLIRKNNFDQAANLIIAKERMRTLLTAEIFEKLVEANPIIMAIDVFSLINLEQLYIKMLSIPQRLEDRFVENYYEHQLSRVFLIGKIWDTIVDGWFEQKNSNIKNALTIIWRNQIWPHFAGKTSEKNEDFLDTLFAVLEALCKSQKKVLTNFNTLIKAKAKSTFVRLTLEQFEQNVPKIRSALLQEHYSNVIAMHQHNKGNNSFGTFLNSNWGPSARLVLFFNNLETALLFFPNILPMAIEEKDINKWLVTHYKRALMFECAELEKSMSYLAANVLVQYKEIDKCFTMELPKKKIKSNWNKYRIGFIIEADRFADGNEQTDWIFEEYEQKNIVLLDLRRLCKEEHSRNATIDIYDEIRNRFGRTLWTKKVLQRALQQWHFAEVVDLLERDGNFRNFLSNALDSNGEKRLVKLIGKWPEKELGRYMEQNQQQETFVEPLTKPILSIGTSKDEDNHLMDLYKVLLDKNPDEWKNAVLDAAETAISWYYKDYISKIFERLKEISRFENLTNQLKDEYFHSVMIAEENKMKTICRLEFFFSRRLVNNEQLASDPEWADKLSNFNFMKFDSKITSYNACEEEDVIARYKRMTEGTNLQAVHCICIIELLGRSPEFRTYFGVNKKTRQTKMRLRELVGEYIRKLEEFFLDGMDVDRVNTKLLGRMYCRFLADVQILWENNEKRKQLDLRAAIWHYENILKELFEIAERILDPLEYIFIAHLISKTLTINEDKEYDYRLCKVVEFIVQKLLNYKNLVNKDCWIEAD